VSYFTLLGGVRRCGGRSLVWTESRQGQAHLRHWLRLLAVARYAAPRGEDDAL